jgi:diguanylate cyclase (GGDEF)-like protein/PAS domain S-box-containing protein
MLAPDEPGGMLVENKRIWTNNELEDLVRQLNIALEASGIGIWQHNLLKNQTRWDEQLQGLYGVPKGPLDVVWLECVHPEDRDASNAIFEKAIAERSDYASQFRIVRPDGSIRHLRSRAKFFLDANNEPCFIGAEWDVTEDVIRSQQLAEEREAAERSRAEAKHIADHDHLTGLFNRRSFDALCANLASLDEIIEVWLCHVDIDYFKEINDRYGHASGDMVLLHVGQVLAGAVGPGDIAARLGGDEFAVLSANVESFHMASLVADIQLRLKEPILVDGTPVAISCSIGIARSLSSDVNSLLASSDLALYEAKRKGRSRAEIFSPALAAMSLAEKHTLYEIRDAISSGEFVPFYQVQVDAKSHTISGMEALARWNHTNEIRLPATFLDAATSHGLIGYIDEIILEKVLVDLARWSFAGLNVPRLSINLSAPRLSDVNFVAKLKRLQIPPGRISFELVETIFLDSLSPQIKQNIAAIRELGIDIEIDDLGSGHASLLGLIELRPERVKIDRQLVLPIRESLTQQRLIGSLVEIAKTLDIKVVAEGVETLTHGSLLTDLGVDFLQGYAFGRPEPANVVERLLEIQR